MFSPKAHHSLNINSNKEESNIYKLVDLISSIQKKISSLTRSMEHTKKNELYQKLSLIEDEIIKNKKKINNYISKQKQNEINFNKMKFDNEILIKKLDDELEEITQRINNIVWGGKNNDKEIYQISKNNLNKIIIQKKNENELKNLNIDYNSIIVAYQNLLNVLEVNINKRYQLTEKLNMLQEEKNISEEKIIEYISKKESLEEVSKIYLLKFFNEILSINIKDSDEINNEEKIENTNIIRVNSSQNNNIVEPSNGAHSTLLNNKNVYLNTNYNNFNIDNDNFKIYLYELNIIDINNLCKEIAIQIVLAINSCIKSLYLNNKSLSNSLLYNSGNKIDNNLSNMNNTQVNSTTIIYNSKDKNSFINLMASKIKKGILTFMNNISSNHNNNLDDSEKLIDEFFTNLSKNIINYLNNIFNSQLLIKQKEENLSEVSNNVLVLSLYLKLTFKKFYLDKVIQNECDFIKNQYKNNEKNIKNFLELTIANINKLNNKKQEYDNKIDEIKHKKQLLQEKFINDKAHLSLKDKAYFELTKKSNELIENKNQINEEFNSMEKEYEKENENIYQKILNREKKLNDLEKEKILIEEKMAKKNKVIMIEIEKLKKIINEKFKMIKIQIDIYKKKYGNSFDLYDRFIEKINESLRLTSKSLMRKNDVILNRTFSNNFFTPNNRNITKNIINNTFYKLNNNNYNGINNINNIKSNNNTTIKNQRPFSKDSIYYSKNFSDYNKYIKNRMYY